MTNIKPLGTLILIDKMKNEEKKTASGLVLTAASLDEELQRGTVIAVGDGTRDIQGNLHPLNVQVGDIVYFNDAHLTEVTDEENNKYNFIAYSNLFGKVTNA
jgi:chaperonin GroES